VRPRAGALPPRSLTPRLGSKVEAEAGASRSRAEADVTVHGVRAAGEAEAFRTRAQGVAEAAALALEQKIWDAVPKASPDRERILATLAGRGLRP